MVRITVYRLYTAEEAVALAVEPDLLSSRIKADRQRAPMAIIDARDAFHAAAVIDILSSAFGVAIMDVEHDPEDIEDTHFLLDQGRAMLKDAKRLSRQSKKDG